MAKKIFFIALLACLCLTSGFANFNMYGAGYCFYVSDNPAPLYIAHSICVQGGFYWGQSLGFAMDFLIGFSESNQTYNAFELIGGATLGLGADIPLSDALGIYIDGGLHLGVNSFSANDTISLGVGATAALLFNFSETFGMGLTFSAAYDFISVYKLVSGKSVLNNRLSINPGVMLVFRPLTNSGGGDHITIYH